MFLLFQIESDFSFVFGSKNTFFDQVEDFLDLMVSKVFPTKLAKKEEIDMLTIIIDKKSELHPSNVDLFLNIYTIILTIK